MKSLRHRIAESGNETAARSAGAGLRIIGHTPRFSIERRDQARLRLLLLVAVIRRIRLPRDDKHFADADVIDVRLGNRLALMNRPHLQPVPTAHRNGNVRGKIGLAIKLRQRRPGVVQGPVQWFPRQPPFDADICNLSARQPNLTLLRRLPLRNLPIDRRREDQRDFFFGASCLAPNKRTASQHR